MSPSQLLEWLAVAAFVVRLPVTGLVWMRCDRQWWRWWRWLWRWQQRVR